MGVGAGLSMYDVVVKKFTFTISSPDESLVDKSGTEVTTLSGKNEFIGGQYCTAPSPILPPKLPFWAKRS